MPVSASQIETWLSCQRKWGAEKLDGLVRPTNAGALRGTEVHHQLELWFGTGGDSTSTVPTDPSDLAALALVPLLEPYRETALVEESFSFEYEDITFTGRVDWMTETIIGDHKTTKNLKYALKDLSTNVQAMLYAFALKKYELHWNYVSTETFKVRALHQTVSPEQVESFFLENILPHARAIELARSSGKGMLDLDPTPRSCGMYGGCPFRDICKLKLSDYTRANRLPRVPALLVHGAESDEGALSLSRHDEIPSPPVEIDATVVLPPVPECDIRLSRDDVVSSIPQLLNHPRPILK